MSADNNAWPSKSAEASYYRRKARDAERAAETAETTEAKQFYLEMAKSFHEAADNAERNGS